MSESNENTLNLNALIRGLHGLWPVVQHLDLKEHMTIDLQNVLETLEGAVGAENVSMAEQGAVFGVDNAAKHLAKSYAEAPGNHAFPTFINIPARWQPIHDQFLTLFNQYRNELQVRE